MTNHHLESAFDRGFRTWAGDGERRWAEHAWPAVRDPDADLDTQPGRLSDLIRLLSLAALTQEFYAYAYAEGTVGEWADNLVEPVEAAGLLDDQFQGVSVVVGGQ